MTFAEILDQYGIPSAPAGSHHHVRPGWIGFDCPRCTPGSGRFRAGFNLNSKSTYCWACGRLDAVETLVELTHLPYRDVRELLKGMPSATPTKPVERRGTLRLPEGRDELLRAHREYLRSRGLDPDEIRRLWEVQGIGRAEKYAWSVYAPIIQAGEVVSWTTRKIDPQKGWFHSPPQDEAIPLKRLLYGEDYCRRTIVICEGVGDVWKIGPGAVATFGVGYSRAQMRRMAKYPERVILYDSNDEGQQRAKVLLSELMVFPGRTHNVVLDAADPGSADAKEVRKFRKTFLDD